MVHPSLPASLKWKQDNSKFKASLSYTVRDISITKTWKLHGDGRRQNGQKQKVARTRVFRISEQKLGLL